MPSQHSAAAFEYNTSQKAPRPNPTSVQDAVCVSYVRKGGQSLFSQKLERFVTPGGTVGSVRDTGLREIRLSCAVATPEPGKAQVEETGSRYERSVPSLCGQNGLKKGGCGFVYE
ncbi:hypothetical protein MUG91_G218n1p11 [Manis pentadactyla]|nr:hypothetical protein MUG91_G218n1p11 [Manis pentadactyla]